MDYTSQRVRFDNGRGQSLAGLLDQPAEGEVRCWSTFTHCFTCTKDLKALAKISRRLTGLGIGVLRFDFTGLGDSGGEFADTDFQTNVADCRAAAEWMASEGHPPQLLMGLSLGGAAQLVAAGGLPTVRAVATIASPSSTQHLARFLAGANPEIERTGQGLVTIGPTAHPITRRMVEVLRATQLDDAIRSLKLPLLIAFSPDDETLPFAHAFEMFRLAGGPVSFVTLDGADHLLVKQPEDVNWLADLIATWSSRFMTVG